MASNTVFSPTTVALARTFGMSSATAPLPRFFAATPASAASADAGDCFETGSGLHCLPSLINIGVQKAGTGELQNWLTAHPSFVTHGGIAHTAVVEPLKITYHKRRAAH